MAFLQQLPPIDVASIGAEALGRSRIRSSDLRQSAEVKLTPTVRRTTGWAIPMRQPTTVNLQHQRGPKRRTGELAEPSN
jgi:hypothetical protein